MLAELTAASRRLRDRVRNSIGHNNVIDARYHAMMRVVEKVTVELDVLQGGERQNVKIPNPVFKSNGP